MDSDGSVDIIRFVHFTRRTRTAVDVVQLISCRFNAPNSNDVTGKIERKPFMSVYNIKMKIKSLFCLTFIA